MNIFSLLRSSFTLIAALFLVGCCVCAILAARYIFRKPSHTCRQYPSFVSRAICRLAGVQVKIKGTHHLDPQQVYVFCGNHTSQFDIFSFHGYFPQSVRGIGKQELFSIPVFGHAMLALGHIPINRKRGREAMKSLDEAAEKIKTGASVLIFPEGTRSSDGNLLPFKGGAILLAIKANVPVVPVTFLGSYDVLPKDTLLAKPGTITVKVGKPIDSSHYSTKERNVLAKRVHEIIDDTLQAHT